MRNFTHAGGIDLHWVEEGSGRPTVLLHGVCDSHRTWRKLAPALSRSRRLLMLDLPGHGLSDRPDAIYSVEWYAQVVGAWLDALGLRSFDLVGHSFGGGVAQMLLVDHGERVDRLALVASGGLGREVNLGLRLWSAFESAEFLAQPFLAPTTRLALASLLPGMDPEDVAFLSWMNAMPGTGRALSRTVRSSIDWKGQKLQFLDRARELERNLPRIALFWGERDPIIPIEHGEEMAALLENVTLTRFACGHWPHLEAADEFASALTKFLDGPGGKRARIRRAELALPEPRLRWWRAMVRWVRKGLAAFAAHFRRRRR